MALIMDGNARWAEQRRLPVQMGHERGVDTLRMMVRCCGAWSIPAVTVYAFSQENWNRAGDAQTVCSHARDRARVESHTRHTKQSIYCCTAAAILHVVDYSAIKS